MALKDVIQQSLLEIFGSDLRKIARVRCCELTDWGFRLEAFGELWDVTRDGIFLRGEREEGPKGVLLALYLKHAKDSDSDMALLPFRSFKELPGSMPYQDAFKLRAEMVLVPYTFKIMKHYQKILGSMRGEDAKGLVGGDMAFILRPFPKIALAYIFYLPDEDFPASVTCLFSSNAQDFMPVDGLADTAEQTSKTIISML
jgi:hypothetical protein